MPEQIEGLTSPVNPEMHDIEGQFGTSSIDEVGKATL